MDVVENVGLGRLFVASTAGIGDFALDDGKGGGGGGCKMLGVLKESIFSIFPYYSFQKTWNVGDEVPVGDGAVFDLMRLK